MDTAQPPEPYRPPPGEWKLVDHPYLARLLDTDVHQDALAAVFAAFKEEDRGPDPRTDPETCATGWLTLGRGEDANDGRVAVLVGAELIGLLDPSDSDLVLKQVMKSERRHKAIWVEVWIDLVDGRYDVEVKLPIPAPPGHANAPAR